MYKTKGTIDMYAIDTGEAFKYKGRLNLWDYKDDTDYDLSESSVKVSYDHACKRLGRKIKNPALVIIVDEDDSDYSMRAWVNMKDIKKSILHQQKIFVCKPEHMESVWLEMPVRSRKSLWMRNIIDQVFDRMPESKTKDYAVNEVEKYWNAKLEVYAAKIQCIIDNETEWFELEIKDFAQLLNEKVSRVYQSSFYAYYRDHECDWKNTKLRQALYVHRII